jgi:hypothetical protein
MLAGAMVTYLDAYRLDKALEIAATARPDPGSGSP